MKEVEKAISFPLLNEEEEKKLLDLLKSNEKEAQKRAKEKLILSNLRLVISVISKYKITGHLFDDLFQEGVLGLLIAIEKFEQKKENPRRFSTYALYWIRQSIIRALQKEMKESLGLSKRIIRQYPEIKKIIERNPQNHPEITTLLSPLEIQRLYFPLQSLDRPIKENEEASLNEIVGKDRIKEEIEEMLKKERVERFFSSISVLSEKEKRIIELRYGLKDGRPRTLREIAQSFNPPYTAERIRQILEKSLKKIKSNIRRGQF